MMLMHCSTELLNLKFEMFPIALKMDNSFNGRTNPKLFFSRQPQNKHFRISSLRHSWKIFLEEKEKIHLM